MLWKTKKEKEIPKSQWRHHEMLGTQARSGFYVSDREPLVVYSAVDRTEWLKSFSLIILYLVVCYYMFPQCLCTCINSPLTPYWVVFLEKIQCLKFYIGYQSSQLKLADYCFSQSLTVVNCIDGPVPKNCLVLCCVMEMKLYCLCAVIYRCEFPS